MPHKSAEARREYMRKRRAEKPEFHKAQNRRHREKYPEGYKTRIQRYVHSDKGQTTRKAFQRGWKYGLTLDQIKNMLELQGHQCVICPALISLGAAEHKNQACVDHCHATGKVRGLLCHKCNKAIGCFDDDPDIVRRAAIYLQQHKEGNTP